MRAALIIIVIGALAVGAFSYFRPDADLEALKHPYDPHTIYNEYSRHQGRRVAVTGKVVYKSGLQFHLKTEGDMFAHAFFFLDEDAAINAGDTVTAVGTCGDTVLLEVKFKDAKVSSISH